MHPTLRKTLIGFIAGAVSLLTFHRFALLIVHWMGEWDFPWSLQTNRLGVPVLLNQAFWSGLWGIAFAFAAPRLAGLAWWARGIVLGLVGPWILGNLILVPLARGAPLFPLDQWFWISVFALSSFGIGWVIIYDWLDRRLR